MTSYTQIQIPEDPYNEGVSQKKRHNSLENQYFLKIQPPTEPRDYSPDTYLFGSESGCKINRPFRLSVVYVKEDWCICQGYCLCSRAWILNQLIDQLRVHRNNGQSIFHCVMVIAYAVCS